MTRGHIALLVAAMMISLAAPVSAQPCQPICSGDSGPGTTAESDQTPGLDTARGVLASLMLVTLVTAILAPRLPGGKR